MYEIRNVPIGLIDPNPHRDLKTYPWIEAKVEHLMRSIDEVGFWASVIGRQREKRYQLAFGHHRLEAAERLKLKAIPLIITQLDDRKMLQYMGRENGEDYNADFTVMLNTWEGAVKFLMKSEASLKSEGNPSTKPLDIATILGWTFVAPSDGALRMTDVAQACAAAFALIQGGYQGRQDYHRVSVDAARQIATRTQEVMRQTELMGRVNKVGRTEIEAAKHHVGRAATKTADDYREGNIAKRELRGQVDVNTYRYARDAGVTAPLFATFGTALVAQIERMLNVDTAAEKLDEVRQALPSITESADWQIIQKLDLALEQVGDRAGVWRKRLIPPNKKLVSLSPVGR